MTKLGILKNFIFFIFVGISSHAYVLAGENEIHGLILDRTITLPGHGFYKKFSAHWLAANLSQSGNIVVVEKPSARWGNLILISSKDQVLYRTSIRPGKQLKTNLIKEAVSSVSQKIFNRLLVKRTSQDMSASGY